MVASSVVSASSASGFVDVDGLRGRGTRATRIARPTAASAAATRDDQEARTRAPLRRRPAARENASSVRLPALSCSSIAHEDDQRVAAQQHAAMPIRNSTSDEDEVVGRRHGGPVRAVRRRCASARRVVVAGQLVVACGVGGRRRRPLAVRARDHDAADDGDEQQDRDRLEREQEVAEQAVSPTERRRCRTSAAARRRRRGRRRTRTAMRTNLHDQVDDRAATPSTCASAAAQRHGVDLVAVQDHDDEDEQHHDGAGVDQHLQRRPGSAPTACT